jgi:aminomethyltransferase
MHAQRIRRRTGFSVYTYVPPYLTASRTGMRMKGGLKRTAFYPIISQFATDYRLHNTYLKPEQITDPLEEYWAMRTVAGLWDVTGEEAVEVSGPDATEVMNELVPRDVCKLKDESCLYCVMCYDYGGIIEDAVLMRFNAEKFWWVGGPAPTEQWIYSKSIGKNVQVRSYLDEKHVASIQGPKSREILQRVCDADLSRVPFYGMLAETQICDIPVTISRTGFTAELGYDIYVDIPNAESLFRGLWEAGKADGLQLCGSRALGIRRVEAAILNVGQDFDWTTTPYEINLGWMVELGKPSFCGKEALTRLKSEQPAKRLVGLKLEMDEAASQGDPIIWEDQPAGVITSATLSPSLEGASIAMAMVKTAVAEIGIRLKVKSARGSVHATVVPMPFFDPERKIPKA